eukprot:3074825-Amphidinium_carterae.3
MSEFSTRTLEPNNWQGPTVLGWLRTSNLVASDEQRDGLQSVWVDTTTRHTSTLALLERFIMRNPTERSEEGIPISEQAMGSQSVASHAYP